MRDLSRSEERPVEEVEARRLRKAKFERVRSVSKCKKPELPLATVGTTEEKARRETGIDILGEVRWGTHFCVFYQSKQDLIDILVPYFKEGLENNEFCMWITSEPLSAEDAKKSLSQAVTNLDDYIKKGQIEILDYSDWYTKSGVFEADRVLQGWVQKHDQAIRNGFDGLRLTGNTLWLEKKDWIKFTEYEAVVNSVIGKYRMLAICTYSLDKCGASEILDVEHNHQFALIKWRGNWKILESSSKNQLEARLAEQTAIAKVLERSKKDWVKTFNAMSDWVALIDLKGRILHTNRAGENFTGKTLDEIIGQSCCKLVHGQDKHIPNCPLRTMLHSRQRATAELNVPNTDRWLMVTVDPVVNGKGNLVGAVHITRDITQRKKDEKALRESEERYKYLFEQSPLGIGLSTPDGRVVCGNKAMEVITGYFEEELKKINLADTYENPQDRKKVLETIERYGCAVDFPTRLKRKDGTIYDALLNVSRVHLAGQDLFQTICVDITERKKAVKALLESEFKYRSLFENMLNGFAHCKILLDDNEQPVDFVYLDVNDAFEKLTGLKKEKVLGKKGTEAIPGIKELHPELFDIYGKVALTGKEDRFDIHFKPLDIWPSISVYSPQKGYFVVIFENITERKRAEEALQAANYQLQASEQQLRAANQQLIASEQQLKAANQQLLAEVAERKKVEKELRETRNYLERLINYANAPIIVWDTKFRVTRFNHAFENLTGYAADEVIGQELSILFPKASRDESMRNIESTLRGQYWESVEIPVLRKDGDIRIALWNSANIYGEDGKTLLATIAQGQDITERKQTEEQIEKLARFPAENPNPVLSVSGYGTVIYGNKASVPLLKVWQCRVGESLPAEWYDVILDVLSSGDSQQTEVKYDGRTFSLTFAPVVDANYVNVYGLDITERKRAETKLLDYQEQLKSLASQLTLTEEQERRRIATDLHDNITQSLAMSKLKLDLVCDSNSSSSTDLAEVLNETSKNIEQIMQGVRTLTFDLSSPILYELGFEAAVAEWLTERIEKEHYIATKFEDDGQPKPLDDDTRAVLFRDVRELLTNVVKHAQAKKVKVSVRKDRSRICISVEDDGRGFDPEKAAATAAKAGEFGLFSIRERLKQLGGNIEIESAAGHGTRVTLAAPLKHEG